MVVSKILVLGSVKFLQKFKTGHFNLGRLIRGSIKMGDFEPISSRISETVRDRIKVAVNH